MASIVKRKKKYSVVYNFTNEQGEKKQKWESFDTHKDALRRKNEVESQQDSGTFIPPSDVTLRDFLYDYVKIYGTTHWALSTYEQNVALISNYINPLIGDMPIQDITPKFVDSYYQDLKKTKSVVANNKKPRSEYVTPCVIGNIHKLLRCAFNQALKWELVARNPFPLTNKPKAEYRKRDIWTAEMIRTALDSCREPKLYIAMNLAFACSMRYGEIAGLTWDKVHITDADITNDDSHIMIEQELSRASKATIETLEKKDIIKIFPSLMSGTTTNLVLKKPKTSSSIRKVWLPKTVAYILLEWKKQQDELKSFLGNDYYDFNLVVALQNGRPCENRVMEKEFNNLKKRLDLPNVVFHSLRHSSTTYKLKLNKGDLKATQGDTGHAQIDMITDVYAHILDEDRKINATKFEAAFYSGPDLRNVAAPEDKTASPDVQNVMDLLEKSPELAALISSLVQQAAISRD